MNDEKFKLTITETPKGGEVPLDMESPESFVVTNLAKTFVKHESVFQIFLKSVSLAIILKKCPECPDKDKCTQMDFEAAEVAANMKQIIETGNHGN